MGGQTSDWTYVLPPTLEPPLRMQQLFVGRRGRVQVQRQVVRRTRAWSSSDADADAAEWRRPCRRAVRQCRPASWRPSPARTGARPDSDLAGRPAKSAYGSRHSVWRSSNSGRTAAADRAALHTYTTTTSTGQLQKRTIACLAVISSERQTNWTEYYCSKQCRP